MQGFGFRLRMRLFLQAILLLGMVLGSAPASAQRFTYNMDKWREKFNVGDQVMMSISGGSADYQPCVVTENDPDAVMRVHCQAFKHWPEGDYIASANSTRQMKQTPAAASGAVEEAGGEKEAAPPPRRTAATRIDPSRPLTAARPGYKAVAPYANTTTLKVGEYACTGQGGRMMIGLGFKVVGPNRYTDLDGGRAGTFSISGGNITFNGGHLQGVSGRELTDGWFTVAMGARCGPYR